MKTRAVHWLALLGVMMIAAALMAITWYQRHEMKRLPNERVIGAQLVVEKLSGPRYFQENIQERGSDGEPVIFPDEAHAQVPRIVKERSWNAEQERKLHQLIDKLTEEPASRMVGRVRINLARLNLALDQLQNESKAQP